MKPCMLFLWLTIISAFILLLKHETLDAEDYGVRPREPQVWLGLPIRTLSNINRISAWYDSDGVQEINSATGSAGLIFPRGTAGAIFASGLMWGGEFNDGSTPLIRVNGHSYNTGMVRGAILGVRTGIIEDPNAPDVRIWRVRRDFATADLGQDAAELNGVEIQDVTEVMIAAVRAQYLTDWIEWPAAKGAPFYDSNGDGVYSPVIIGGEPVLYPDADEPGIADADHIVWYVCNDIGGVSPWGATPPAGLEQQGTIWAFDQSGFLGDVLFKRFRMIYKGTSSTPEDATIENMYLSHWSDPDVGSFGDDFAGCDTVLSLGYAYNGGPVDLQYQEFGLAPPAIGYDFFQGPIVHTGNPADTAIFDLKKVPGALNLPMTSFICFSAGGIYSDPPFNYSGALQWNCMFQGRPPAPQPPPCPAPPIDPYSGVPAGPFWLYGGSDGYSAPNLSSPNGWVDGMIDSPGDRRIIQSSGPFVMAVGDTQEIVVGVVAASSNSYLSSVTRMKNASHNIQTMYDWLFTAFPPTFSVDVVFPNSIVATLTIFGDGRTADALSIEVDVKEEDGSLVLTALLYDDGTHGDETAGDEIFTNSVIVGRQAAPLHLDANVVDNSGRSLQWNRVYDGIGTVGTVSLSSEQIFSDNLNNDGLANPGENIRYGFTTRYSGIASLEGLTVAPQGGGFRYHDLFEDGDVDSMVYNPDLPESFFSFNIPATFEDSVYHIPVSISDSSLNRWDDTVTFQVYPFPDLLQNAIVSHPVGTASGNFEIVVVDAGQVNDHLYALEGVNEPDGTLGITLRDSTDGRLLLLDHPLPDEYGHNMPVTDGFKVMLGSIGTEWGWDDWSIPQGEQRWAWNGASGLNLEGFNGAIGMGYEQWFSSSLTPPHRLRSVLTVFAATDASGNLVDPNDSTASLAYRYLQNADQPAAKPEFVPYIVNPDTGFAYQDFQRALPFAVYDMNSIPPRRLLVGLMENNVNCGLVDGKYWPPLGGLCFLCRCNWHEIHAREWFFIFDAPYDETPNPQFQVDIESETLPLMWWGTPTRLAEGGFQAGDQFLISATFPFTSQDVWTFNPTVVVGVEDSGLPSTYNLWQNYPNPFNPSTTIAYELPEPSKVTLRIYDILGREVRTLVNDVQSTGRYRMEWFSENNYGTRVASGVYFYRLEAGDFVQTKKLILLR